MVYEDILAELTINTSVDKNKHIPIKFSILYSNLYILIKHMIKKGNNILK